MHRQDVNVSTFHIGPIHVPDACAQGKRRSGASFNVLMLANTDKSDSEWSAMHFTPRIALRA